MRFSSGLAIAPASRALHARKGLLRQRFHLGKEIVAKTHPADVEREAKRFVAQEIFLITIPKRTHR